MGKGGPQPTGILICDSILLKHSNFDLSNYITYFLKEKSYFPFRTIRNNQLLIIADTQKLLRSVTPVKVI